MSIKGMWTVRAGHMCMMRILKKMKIKKEVKIKESLERYKTNFSELLSNFLTFQ